MYIFLNSNWRCYCFDKSPRHKSCSMLALISFEVAHSLKSRTNLKILHLIWKKNVIGFFLYILWCNIYLGGNIIIKVLWHHQTKDGLVTIPFVGIRQSQSSIEGHRPFKKFLGRFVQIQIFCACESQHVWIKCEK